jgi:hypothetical protein
MQVQHPKESEKTREENIANRAMFFGGEISTRKPKASEGRYRCCHTYSL